MGGKARTDRCRSANGRLSRDVREIKSVGAIEYGHRRGITKHIHDAPKLGTNQLLDLHGAQIARAKPQNTRTQNELSVDLAYISQRLKRV